MPESSDPNKKNGDDDAGKRPGGMQETAIILARLSGIGWYVAGSIGIGLGAGWLLDRQFGTEPVLLLVGLVLGVIAAFVGMIRLLNAFGHPTTRR